MLKITYTLFHSKNCVHCIHFMPEWEKFKKKITTLSSSQVITKSKIPVEIETHDYEASNIPPEKGKINGEELIGFPTLKVEIDHNENHSEFEYDGKRKADELYDFTLDIVRDVSSGKRR